MKMTERWFLTRAGNGEIIVSNFEREGISDLAAGSVEAIKAANRLLNDGKIFTLRTTAFRPLTRVNEFS